MMVLIVQGALIGDNWRVWIIGKHQYPVKSNGKKSAIV